MSQQLCRMLGWQKIVSEVSRKSILKMSSNRIGLGLGKVIFMSLEIIKLKVKFLHEWVFEPCSSVLWFDLLSLSIMKIYSMLYFIRKKKQNQLPKNLQSFVFWTVPTNKINDLFISDMLFKWDTTIFL